MPNQTESENTATTKRGDLSVVDRTGIGQSTPAVDRGGHVLWAEDNPQDQILIRSAFEDVVDAPLLKMVNDGVYLLEEARKSRPKMVVLDLKMPRLGGLETLRRIRDDSTLNDLPICIFSAGNQPEETEACRTLGVVDVVQKPVDFEQFTTAVQQIVRHAQT